MYDLMRINGLLAIGLFLLSLTGWETDLDLAKSKAKQEHKFILLNFSGSDWCIPCINMRHDIFDSKSFTEYADNNLVLLNADFPRLKKNRLPKEQEEKNNHLADRYNPQGIFPLTVLLDADGKVIYKWEGAPRLSAAEFIAQVKSKHNAGN
jgi:thioredoxin-related protein